MTTTGPEQRELIITTPMKDLPVSTKILKMVAFPNGLHLNNNVNAEGVQKIDNVTIRNNAHSVQTTKTSST